MLSITEKYIVLASQVQGLFQISPTLMNLLGGLDGPTDCKKLREAVHWKRTCPKIIVVELLLLN